MKQDMMKESRKERQHGERGEKNMTRGQKADEEKQQEKRRQDGTGGTLKEYEMKKEEKQKE